MRTATLEKEKGTRPESFAADALNAGEKDEFAALASRLGHDLRTLDHGEKVTSRPYAGDLAEMREVFVRADDATRRRRQFAFDHLKSRARLWQGVHDRGEANIFADLPVLDSDFWGLGHHFPARIKAISIRNLELGPGEVLDITTTPEEWGVWENEELYVLLNVDRCTLRHGGRICVQGNVLSIVIQRLDIVAAPWEAGMPTQSHHHIAILPTRHPVDAILDGPLDGPDGVPGESGLSGRPGRSCRYAVSLLGPIIKEVPPRKDRDGGDGMPGAPGGRGRRGRPGGMCKTAEITIRSFAQESAPLLLFAQAGRGGHGGRGGAGGNGGDGGAAGHGIAGRLDLYPHGRPGAGGAGGAAGNGGCGGNGGISSNIFISCPPDREHLVRTLTLPSVPGLPGEGGAGGAGGPGHPGTDSGMTADPGRPGAPGKPGLPGRPRPAARVYVNEKARFQADLERNVS